jgi:hypothetical protein
MKTPTPTVWSPPLQENVKVGQPPTARCMSERTQALTFLEFAKLRPVGSACHKREDETMRHVSCAAHRAVGRARSTGRALQRASWPTHVLALAIAVAQGAGTKPAPFLVSIFSIAGCTG